MSDSVCCCPKCSRIAIKDREERTEIGVTAITSHIYCQKCGSVEEVFFITEKTEEGKFLARLIAAGI